MPKQGINEWWAVAAPYGGIYIASITDDPAYAMEKCVKALGKNVKNAQELQSLGHRVVKVRITEIQEWGE